MQFDGTAGSSMAFSSVLSLIQCYVRPVSKWVSSELAMPNDPKMCVYVCAQCSVMAIQGVFQPYLPQIHHDPNQNKRSFFYFLSI